MNYPLVEKFLLTLDAKPLAVCLYGSYFSGNWVKDSSDVDLILFMSGKNIREHRIHTIDGVEVHATSISMDVLQSDVYSQKYGYLYISKFLNPHIFLDDNGDVGNKIIELVSKYLEDYCFDDIFDKPINLKQIVSRILLIHLNNFPHYAIKLVQLPKLREKDFCFDLFQDNYLKFLEQSSVLSVDSNGKYYLKGGQNIKSYRSFFHEKTRLIWWQTYQNYRDTENFLREKMESYEGMIDDFNDDIVDMLHSLESAAG